MVGRVGALYELQLIDKESGEIRATLDRLESELEQSEELLSAGRKLAEAEESLRKSRAEVRRLELDLQGISSKITSTGAALYGGEVTNPKELASLQQEMEYLQRRQSEIEDSVLEMMAEAEERESRLGLDREHVQSVEQEWGAQEKELRQQAKELRSRLASLQEARRQTLGGVSVGDLAVYEGLRRRKGGQAVALLEGGICQGCRVALPTSLVQKVRRGEDLILCGSCQRILSSLA